MAFEKLEHLQSILRSCGSCLVAYSGGVDSVFLAYVARQVLGDKSLAAIADSPSLPRREFGEALAIAEKFGIPVRVVRTHEFANPEYLANSNNRCYFCKHELFTELLPLARTEGFSVIVYGENASDIGDYRPGAQAAAEFQVRAPLKEAGLTKADIRELSAHLGLPTADKPQMACLSSRVPYGESVTPEKLAMVEQAENVLRDLGFYDVRVRHHELPTPSFQFAGLPGSSPESESPDATVERRPLSAALVDRRSTEPPLRVSSSANASLPASATGAVSPKKNGLRHLARIEVGPDEMRHFLENGKSAKVAEALKQIGYAHVTLDLQGYRRGSANEVLAEKTLKR